MTSPVTGEISDPAATLALHRCDGLAAQQCEYIAPKRKSKDCRGGAGSQADPVRNRREDQPEATTSEASGTWLRSGTTRAALEHGRRSRNNDHIASTSADDARDSDRAPIQDARKRRMKWTNEMNEFIIRSYYIATQTVRPSKMPESEG
ncbi:hypothetical protein QE152_g8825 [Popillia japonica]|uniref:Uncharacterized protein n=1 Tax=Popillia japonica TaxID=7064 RepID=A0AAW1M186_POPJA